TRRAHSLLCPPPPVTTFCHDYFPFFPVRVTKIRGKSGFAGGKPPFRGPLRPPAGGERGGPAGGGGGGGGGRWGVAGGGGGGRRGGGGGGGGRGGAGGLRGGQEVAGRVAGTEPLADPLGDAAARQVRGELAGRGDSLGLGTPMSDDDRALQAEQRGPAV